jgi:hypothetical protein
MERSCIYFELRPVVTGDDVKGGNFDVFMYYMTLSIAEHVKLG